MVPIAKINEDGTWRIEQVTYEELHGVKKLGTSARMQTVYDYFSISQLETALYWNMMQLEMAIAGATGGIEYLSEKKKETDEEIEELKEELQWVR